MRPLESTVRHTRRNLRTLLALGALLALVSLVVGGFLFVLGRPRPDVTLTFSEFGEYVAVLGGLHLLFYTGLFWQLGQLSRRPRLTSGPLSKGLEPIPGPPHTARIPSPP